MGKKAATLEDPIIQRLQIIADTSPDLRVAARLYQIILPLIRDADVPASIQKLDSIRVRACLDAAIPVLSELEIDIDFEKLKELLVKLLQAVESISKASKKQRHFKIWQKKYDVDDFCEQSDYRSISSSASYILALCADECLDLDGILNSAAVGNYDEVLKSAGELKYDAQLLWTLAQNAVKTVLHRCRSEITPMIESIRWEYSHCFICGSLATLGELQNNDQIKHLRCGQCGADWRFSRIQCMYCGNTGHDTQHHISVTGCNSMRIEACSLCHRYLKVINAFSPTPPEMLIVEDIASLHLDFIAEQNGFRKSVQGYM